MRGAGSVVRPLAPASANESPIATVALWLLALFVFSVPLENSIVVPGIGTIGRIIGLVAFVAGIVAVVETGKFRTPIVPHLMMVLFVVWVCLSYFWTIGPEETTEEMISYVQLIAMVLLIWAEAPRARATTAPDASLHHWCDRSCSRYGPDEREARSLASAKAHST